MLAVSPALTHRYFMDTQKRPFWQMAWWECLILLGSLCVIFGFYYFFATEHARILGRFQQTLASHKRTSHDNATKSAP